MPLKMLKFWLYCPLSSLKQRVLRFCVRSARFSPRGALRTRARRDERWNLILPLGELLHAENLNSWFAPATRSAKTDACGRSFAVLSTQVSTVGLRLG